MNCTSTDKLKVKNFYNFARTAFEATTGASNEVAKAQQGTPKYFQNQTLNIETGHKAAKVESEHMLNLSKDKQHKTKQDSLATYASYGKGFSPRNLAARFIVGLTTHAFVSECPKEQKILDMHKKNLYDSPMY